MTRKSKWKNDFRCWIEEKMKEEDQNIDSDFHQSRYWDRMKNQDLEIFLGWIDCDSLSDLNIVGVLVPIARNHIFESTGKISHLKATVTGLDRSAMHGEEKVYHLVNVIRFCMLVSLMLGRSHDLHAYTTAWSLLTLHAEEGLWISAVSPYYQMEMLEKMYVTVFLTYWVTSCSGVLSKEM